MVGQISAGVDNPGHFIRSIGRTDDPLPTNQAICSCYRSRNTDTLPLPDRLVIRGMSASLSLLRPIREVPSGVFAPIDQP